MTLIQSIFLAVVQGITEFLPISSSGHLHLFQYILSLKPSLSFDIFLNTASLLSVLFFFRSQFKFFKDNFKYIVVGTLPAVIIGLFFKDQVELIFQDVSTLPFQFLVTAILLFSLKFITTQNKSLNYRSALVIGLFQALAIIPAISRSGSTIFAGLLMGLSPVAAFNFSFSLFIPASFGALILDLKDMSFSGLFNINMLISFVVCFVVGIYGLKWLRSVLQSRHLWNFSIYLFILSFLLILYR